MNNYTSLDEILTSTENMTEISTTKATTINIRKWLKYNDTYIDNLLLHPLGSTVTMSTIPIELSITGCGSSTRCDIFQYEEGIYNGYFNFLRIYRKGSIRPEYFNGMYDLSFMIIIWETGDITVNYIIKSGDRTVSVLAYDQEPVDLICNSAQPTISFVYENNNFTPLQSMININPAQFKYLFDIDSKYYTVVNDELTELSETALTADVFLTHGFTQLPSNEVLLEHNGLKLLRWYDNEIASPREGLVMHVMPQFPHNIVYYSPIEIPSEKSIKSVDSGQVEGEVLFTVSSDGGETWKYYNNGWCIANNENDGMPRIILKTLGPSQWGLISASTLQIRATLENTKCKVPSELYYQFV